MEAHRPITNYVVPSALWEAWYEEYRFGALYLFPPPPVRARVNALRGEYDPRSQAICDAHVSLTVPLPRPLTQADAAEIADRLGAVHAFTLQWGPPYQYPGVPGVVLRVAPEEPLARLVGALEACRCFVGAPARRHPFSPHMTIAEFITLEDSSRLVDQLSARALEGTFVCDEVFYAVPDATFHFTERHSWPLAKG